MKAGYSASGERRYRCCHPDCQTKSFMLTYRCKAYQPGIKAQGVDMVINSSGIRDTARVLGIDGDQHLKKSGWNHPGKPVVYTLASESADSLEVRLEAICEAELDGQWSFFDKN